MLRDPVSFSGRLLRNPAPAGIQPYGRPGVGPSEKKDDVRFPVRSASGWLSPLGMMDCTSSDLQPHLRPSLGYRPRVAGYHLPEPARQRVHQSNLLLRHSLLSRR